MNKQLKEALYDILKMRVENNNYGMLAKHTPSNKSYRVIYENHITFKGDTILQNGEPIFEILPRISRSKSGGMYKELLPSLISLSPEWDDIILRGNYPDR